ncbi:MAG: hypothetical protein JW797_17165 [Bradymonadales bacterium]|nr:hypothetical protein [Bradymonadales bacterium]
MRQLVLPSIVVTLVCLPTALSAQGSVETTPPGVGDLTQPDRLTTTLDAGIGFSSIGEDGFIETNLGVSLGFGKFEVGLQAPLRWRVIDDPPEDDGAIRGQDWDEPSDWLRILRFIRYGSRYETYYLRGGELVGVVMGHGTIVSGYNNVVDVNHFQWGIDGALNLYFGGLELLLDNIVSAEVMGMRVYLRPWTFFQPDSFWSRLAFGLTFAGDRDVPQRLYLTDTGHYVIDEVGNVLVARRGETGLLGIDAELQVFSNEWVSVTPYTDLNFHLGYGAGFHLGNFANFTFSEAVGLNTRLEFRALGEGYTAEYFDGLYEVEKFLFRPLDATGQRRPKLQVLDLAPPEAAVGYLAQATLGIIQRIFFTLAYEDYEGADNSSVFLRLSMPQLGPVTLGAYFLNQNFDGIGSMFDLDNALVVAEARGTVYGPLYLIANYSRRFTAKQDGTYEPEDDWGVGLGASFSF